MLNFFTVKYLLLQLRPQHQQRQKQQPQQQQAQLPAVRPSKTGMYYVIRLISIIFQPQVRQRAVQVVRVRLHQQVSTSSTWTK